MGSTKSYYWRHLTLGYSSSWRSSIIRSNGGSWININNLEQFEFIFIPNEDEDSVRLLKESRYIKLLKSYLPEYGYNICKNSVGGNGTGGHRWVTNGVKDLLIGLNSDTPEGFFPGQKKRSWVKISSKSITGNGDYEIKILRN